MLSLCQFSIAQSTVSGATLPEPFLAGGQASSGFSLARGADDSYVGLSSVVPVFGASAWAGADYAALKGAGYIDRFGSTDSSLANWTWSYQVRFGRSGGAWRTLNDVDVIIVADFDPADALDLNGPRTISWNQRLVASGSDLNATYLSAIAQPGTSDWSSLAFSLGKGPLNFDPDRPGTYEFKVTVKARSDGAVICSNAMRVKVMDRAAPLDYPVSGSLPLPTCTLGSVSPAPVAPGGDIAVDVAFADLVDAPVGVQLNLAVDTARASFDHVEFPAGSPYQLLFPVQYDANSGNLRIVAGVDPSTWSGSGATSAGLVRVHLSAAPQTSCASTDPVLSFSQAGGVDTLFAASGGTGIPVARATSQQTTILASIPSLGTPGAVAPTPADAGVLGAVIPTQAFAAPAASDACGTSLVPVLSGVPAGNLFPVGTTTLTWTATDAAGRTRARSFDVVVQNHQVMTVRASLNGAGTRNSVRDLRVRLSDGTIVTGTMPFAGTAGADVDLQVPVSAGWTCVSIKDPLHSVARAVYAPVVGTKYVTDQAALVQGDSNDDNQIDILDYGLLVGDYGGTLASPKDAAARSNFNADGYVNTADLIYISASFFQTGDACGGGNLTGRGPIDRISVRDLRRMGLGELAIADVNGDGWLDRKDMALFAQGRRGLPERGATAPGAPANAAE